MAETKCELLTREDQILAVETEWRALFEAAGRPSPFVDYDWALMVWRRLAGSGGTPVVATVREDGRLVMALLLERRRWHLHLHYYAGARIAMPSYDDALIVPTGDAVSWVKAIVAVLRRDPRSIGLHLDSVPQESRLNAVLAGHEVDRSSPYCVVCLTGDYNTYTARFPATTRQADRRQQRHLLPGGNVPLRLGTAETLDADLDWLFMRKRAWQPPTGTLRQWVTDSDYERDVRTLLHKWFAGGGVQLFFIDAPDGTPAAGGMLFIAGRMAIYYLVTYDPRFERVSPGRMLSLKIIEWLYAENYQLLDFMGGKWEWKERLKTDTHRLRTFALGRPWWYRLIRRLARRG